MNRRRVGAVSLFVHGLARLVWLSLHPLRHSHMVLQSVGMLRSGARRSGRQCMDMRHAD